MILVDKQQFRLPWPVSLWKYYHVSFLGKRKGHRKVLTDAATSYRLDVVNVFNRDGLEAMDGPLRMLVECYPQDHRRWDVDNLLKCVLDSLQTRPGNWKGLYKDDHQIRDLRIVDRGVTEESRLERFIMVTVCSLENSLF